MHRLEKKKTLELLEKQRVFNKKSTYLYKIAVDKEKRLVLRNFYYQLYKQKLNFLKEIDEKIEQLKREISPTKDPKMLSFYERQKCELSKHLLKYKMYQRHADILERESKSLKKYAKYLSKTSHARVRELFLKHRHQVKENLKKMTNMTLTKFPIA